MILAIPTIYLEKGKSKYSISGLQGLEKLDSKFRSNPIELAKLFREENNKSILFEIDESLESLKVVSQIRNTFDIPIQITTNSQNTVFLNEISQLLFCRVFLPIENARLLLNSIPIIKLSMLSRYDLSSYSRVMIDFENTKLRNIRINDITKLSIVNSDCDTIGLVNINQTDSNIDSIYLGKEYYGVHYAGQLLWRIAEKAQFAI